MLCATCSPALPTILCPSRVDLRTVRHVAATFIAVMTWWVDRRPNLLAQAGRYHVPAPHERRDRRTFARSVFLTRTGRDSTKSQKTEDRELVDKVLGVVRVVGGERHGGYAASLRVRKRIEEAFGWTKGADGFAHTTPRSATSRLAVHARNGRPQPYPATQAIGRNGMKQTRTGTYSRPRPWPGRQRPPRCRADPTNLNQASQFFLSLLDAPLMRIVRLSVP